MAHIHSINPQARTAGLLEMSIHQGAQLRSLMQQFVQQGKWIYLLADGLRFKKAEAHAMQLSCPDSRQTVEWLEKLITAGKTCALFVEDLMIDEVNRKRLEQLCQQFGVTLIKLNKKKDLDSKLVYGPW
ncbi:hypothetical protein [Bowmanella dokdonensis]|uniref:Uncharacterized protein n=1 Tax=Bowmanella dokdonensis TaxID=751969 RepID=A0A939DL63_9ALTE|nr:hypothetical protein [Bowmanella dokdonensis]MBN7824513.1 hypothetical protein [Bowmanella dokdonensis]